MKRELFLKHPVMLMLLGLLSCNYDNINPNQEIDYTFKEGITVLGKKINDPYSLDNMKLAAQKLKEETNSRLLDEELLPTHRYLRFLPKSEDEWDILKKDTTIILFDYPLDYELEVAGTYYHDPSLPSSAITWQYTVLPIGYDIPPIHKELLYEVFIPEINNEEGLRVSDEKNELYIKLELESFRLTGNKPEEIEKADNSRTSCWLCPDRWHPKGRIMVYDTVVRTLIPLAGAEVHARWSTRIERSITDSNGDFSMGGFIYEVNYSIKWERPYWDIRNGAFGQAWYNGPKRKGDWNLDIVSGESLRYATIHRAAFRYFYRNNLSLHIPVQTSSKIKIAYKDGIGTGDYLGNWDGTGIFPDIRIYGKDQNTGNHKRLNIIYGTTIHELAHASHLIKFGLNRFLNQNKLIRESWADAIEWGITELEYTELGNRLNNIDARNYVHEEEKWRWPTGRQTFEYSPIFRDLVDNLNQRNNFTFRGLFHQGSTLYPDDRVTGFTLKYIEDNILSDSYGPTSLRASVKAKKVSGVTDADIDLLFNLY